jgi:uncharacterized membrane protein
MKWFIIILFFVFVFYYAGNIPDEPDTLKIKKDTINLNEIKIMNNEKITPKVFWVSLIGAIAFVIVTNIFNVFGRINGTAKRVEKLEQTKMNKYEANEYFNKLQTLLATQTATWNQYMISNEKDKERILKIIETNQNDIKELIKNQNKLRSANSQ